MVARARSSARCSRLSRRKSEMEGCARQGAKGVIATSCDAREALRRHVQICTMRALTFPSRLAPSVQVAMPGALVERGPANEAEGSEWI